jgi:inner membrane protein
MDSFTHIALGAITGEIILGKRIGRKAMWLGAFANSFPDIDTVATLWLSPADNLLAHRGFTHSIVCSLVLAAAFTYLIVALKKDNGLKKSAWVLFFGIELILHLFVDSFNAYGIGWLLPFSNSRISFHTIYVVDPFYSGLLILTCIILLFIKKHRLIIAFLALTFSTVYLGYSVYNKMTVNRDIVRSLHQQKINYTRYFTTPTPLNTFLWFIVVEVDSGYQIGYRSVIDKGADVEFQFEPRNEILLAGREQDHSLMQLKSFSQGYYTIETKSDTLIFNDLRFGQIAGWNSRHSPFAFHYYLNYPDENLTVMQRGRFTNWKTQTFSSLIKRIKGEDVY